MSKLDDIRSDDNKSPNEDKNPQGIIPSEQIILFPERLKEITEADSARAFAIKCNLDPKTIRNYLAGKQYPTLDRLALIAEASGRTVSWLATGEEQSSDLPNQNEKLDEQVLQNIIQAIETLLEKKGLSIKPNKKAQMITMIYKLSIRDKNIDHQIVKQAIELAS